MVEAVSLGQVGVFLQSLISVYDDYLYFAFVMMIAFAVGGFVKYILTGSR